MLLGGNFKLLFVCTSILNHPLLYLYLHHLKVASKIWSNKFEIVMINYSKLCASLQENLMSEFCVNGAKVKF